MRARLTLLLLALMAVVPLGFAVPLAHSTAAAAARELYLDRLAEVTRLAGLAAVEAGNLDLAASEVELASYQAARIQVALVGPARAVLTGELDVARLTDGQGGAALTSALAGRRSAAPAAVLPWRTSPLVVAAPVVRDGRVRAAMVSVSDTGAARGQVLRGWAVLLTGEVVLLLAATVLARRLAHWVLAPVAALDAATQQIAGGDLSAQVPSAVGPPELRRLGDSFNAMARTLQESLATQRAFVADAGHQLRNPLGALLVRIESLALTLPAEDATAARRALADGRHLAGALDAMLELARAEHTGSAAVALDVALVVDQRLEAWRMLAARRGVALVRHGVLHAAGRHDPMAVAGSLDAVLDNALKVSTEGGQVSVGVRAAADGTAVVVRDQGPGLSAEELTRVTDRFWRSRRHTNLPGSGLGMSIARSLMERHHGSLEVAADPGGGLVVTLHVPRPAAGDD